MTQPNDNSPQETLNTSVDLGNRITLEMVKIPEGSFLMGSAPKDRNSNDNEKKQRDVEIKSFHMGKYPITQEQWREIANRLDLKIERHLRPNPAYFNNNQYKDSDSDRRPVEQVSWHEAIEFCGRLSKLTGQDYRLPSEAAWEYACRATTTTAYYFGININIKLVNHLSKLGKTTPVNKYPANKFGLHDMHGNVWEWCLDPWHENYEGAPTDGSVWDEQNNNDRYQNILNSISVLFRDDRSHVLRGGSWRSDRKDCRSASRGKASILSADYTGFRVVLPS